MILLLYTEFLFSLLFNKTSFNQHLTWCLSSTPQLLAWEKEVSVQLRRQATRSHARAWEFQNKVLAQFGQAVLSNDLVFKGLFRIISFSTKMPNFVNNISWYLQQSWQIISSGYSSSSSIKVEITYELLMESYPDYLFDCFCTCTYIWIML